MMISTALPEPGALAVSEAIIADHMNHSTYDLVAELTAPGQHAKPSPLELVVVVIEPRALVRDCLIRCLTASGFTGRFAAFANINEWLETAPSEAEFLVLLSVHERKNADKERDFSFLASVDAKVVLLAEEEEACHVVAAINKGIKGYIPMSVPFSVAIEAMRLVCAGGIFVPASCVMNGYTPATKEKAPAEFCFTSKQISVINALRQGKSNKIIAYELDMAESTVKVHVRNVMRKLKAHNRTEVAFMLTRMDPPIL